MCQKTPQVFKSFLARKIFPKLIINNQTGNTSIDNQITFSVSLSAFSVALCVTNNKNLHNLSHKAGEITESRYLSGSQSCTDDF